MTRTVVVGGGPVGTFCAVALARRGHDVVFVDRDPGPVGEVWDRLGVMQFEHPHFFRHIFRNGLLAEMPDMCDAIVAAGAVPTPMPGMPDEMTSLASRRSTVERAMRAKAAMEPGVTMVCGHADGVVTEAGRITGVRVDNRVIDADLVISATGRASHFADDLRGPVEGGPCGFAYVSRMYRAKDGTATPDSPTPIGAMPNGYISIVFPQDDRTLSALIVRPAEDKAFGVLRETRAFEAAVAAIPNLAPWTDPEHFEPISAVMPGGGLTNTFAHQGPEPGTPPARGLFFVGDAVSTTNPQAGRGASLGIQQAQQLLTTLDDTSLAADEASTAFDTWCTDTIKPWYEDHAHWDATLLDRFAGNDIDVDAPLASDVICAAAGVDFSMLPTAGPFMGMMIGPRELRAVEEKARDVLRTGWRPEWAPGPSRDELLALLPNDDSTA